MNPTQVKAPAAPKTPITSITSITPPKIGTGKRGKEGHIAYLLRQAQGSVRHALDQNLSELGLTSPQFIVLTLIDAYPCTSGAELARIAQLTPQTMNLIVRKLERDDLLSRSEPGAHGRMLQLALTANGKIKLRQSRLRADTVEEKVLTDLSPNDERIIRAWLTRVAVSLDE
jgi:DNA-binding MarR family transcriptional regulator